MRLYFKSMKKNIFLTLSTITFLILTVWFWYGVPLFGLTDYFFETNVPGLVQFIFICLGVGFCFALFLIPFHLIFAKEYVLGGQKSMIKVFLITQGVSIMCVAILFSFFYLIASFVLI